MLKFFVRADSFRKLEFCRTDSNWLAHFLNVTKRFCYAERHVGQTLQHLWNQQGVRRNNPGRIHSFLICPVNLENCPVLFTFLFSCACADKPKFLCCLCACSNEQHSVLQYDTPRSTESILYHNQLLARFAKWCSPLISEIIFHNQPFKLSAPRCFWGGYKNELGIPNLLSVP
jgi:hypothetical protein